jgi:3D (Asp-Asp-Asp) domain-containing protein
LEKGTVERFSGVFLRLINLAAVICIVSLIADIARPVRNSGNPNEQGKSNISNRASTKTNGPITLLNATLTDAETTGGCLLNEPGIMAEPKAQRPENTTNKQSDKSESNGEETSEWESIKMRVTAYCPCSKCCGRYSDGVTACGHKIRTGDTFVAADKRYPFGTEMLIPGYGNSQRVQVLDRGGATKGNRLDVFFDTHEEALEWGVRYLDIKVRHK